MEVDMHDVSAHVAGLGHSEQSVHVGAVEVEHRAACVQHRRNFLNFGFKDAERIGVRYHQGGNIVTHQAANFARFEVATRTRRRNHDFETGKATTGGVGAVRGIGNDHLAADFAALFFPCTNHQ